MLLRNLHSIPDNGLVDLKISGYELSAITACDADVTGKDGNAVIFTDAIVFPGLINSHDHLDFNLYPQLGKGSYNNYVEWGTDIHKGCKDTIDKVLNIPKALRVQWGIYKNLLNGITTVVNHGEELEIEHELINVYQACNVLHSVKFEKNWKYKLNKPFVKNQPFVLHIGEGKDVSSWEEINSVIKWNILKRKIYAVHGIAMDITQARSFEALIWCPYSNYFLIGETADIAQLKHSTNILFGTDSTISASWNLWDHLNIARKEKALSNAELFNSLTITAANNWKIAKTGTLEAGRIADVVIARKKDDLSGFDAFFALDPADILMVVHGGNIRLFDGSMVQQLAKSGVNTNTFSKIIVNEQVKYVAGDLPGLMDKIRSYYHDIVFPVNIAV